MFRLPRLKLQLVWDNVAMLENDCCKKKHGTVNCPPRTVILPVVPARGRAEVDLGIFLYIYMYMLKNI